MICVWREGRAQFWRNHTETPSRESQRVDWMLKKPFFKEIQGSPPICVRLPGNISKTCRSQAPS